jgi:hypothetical protein
MVKFLLTVCFCCLMAAVQAQIKSDTMSAKRAPKVEMVMSGEIIFPALVSNGGAVGMGYGGPALKAQITSLLSLRLSMCTCIIKKFDDPTPVIFTGTGFGVSYKHWSLNILGFYNLWGDKTWKPALGIGYRFN